MSEEAQGSVVQWMQPSMSTDQQERSERELALLQVTHAVPYHALECEEMKAFCRGLSTKFVVQSRRTLQRRVGELYGEFETAIEARLKVCILSHSAITHLISAFFRIGSESISPSMVEKTTKRLK